MYGGGGSSALLMQRQYYYLLQILLKPLIFIIRLHCYKKVTSGKNTRHQVELLFWWHA